MLLGDRFGVESAGTCPAPRVNPVAVRVMAEVVVDISGAVPQSVTPLRDRPYDLAVTACDSARESCPLFPGA